MSGTAPTPYDQVPYPSAPYAQSHPGRLAAVGTLFGMRPPPPRGARVLELGCADGSNLIPMAMDLPAASFMGLDLSSRQVAGGLELVRRLGLSNIRLECRDIRDLDREPGPFDYVIAHGVFSWVPHDVQESILGACGRLLSEQGIAYVSYNTYPGWHLRGMLRRMMLYHTEQVADPDRQVCQARALVRFLAEAVPAEGEPYGMLLHKELRQMEGWDDAYLRHDVLEEVNEPVYFHEFARRAGVHGLRYLGEAEFHTMVGDNLPPDVARTLRRITADLLQTEQYMDFVRNRMFRQTLLCRREVALERRVTPPRLAGLWVSAPLREQSPEGGDRPAPEGLPAVFTHPDGGTIRAGSPVARDAFRRIAAAWPAAVQVSSLLEMPGGVAGTGAGATGGGGLADTLLACVSRGLLEVSAHAPACAAKPGARPWASPLARAQARTSLLVTTLRHDAARLEPVHAHLLPLLDGTRTAEALVEALIPAATNGPLSVRDAGRVVRDPQRLRPLLREVLHRSLDQLARLGLLTGEEGRGRSAD
jgi:SAM-dependent methyltransferase